MTMTGQLWPYRGIRPTLHESVFIAPGTHVIGDVHIAEGASLWFNCVARGDVNSIRIGARTNIQDGTIVHVTGGRFGTSIGSDVLIGHQCLIHGCRLEDESFIGMGATVMDGCVVERRAMLGAGSLLSPGKVVKAGQLWLGRPARYVRDLTAAEIAANVQAVVHYAKLAEEYRLAGGSACAAEPSAKPPV